MSDVRERFYSRGYYRGVSPEPRFKEVVKIFSKLKGERLLDVGCGDGAITFLLKKSMDAKEVFGVDIADEGVIAAREKGINAYQIDVDQGDLPFDKGYFDVVYCGEIIEHVFDPDHLLEQVYRVLSPKGCCIISTPNLAGWPNRFALLLGYQPYPMAISPRYESLGKMLVKGSEGQWGHIRVMTLRALEELVRLHGFRVRETVGCVVMIKTPLPGFLSSLIKLVDRIMSNFPSLSTRIIMVLEKESVR